MSGQKRVRSQHFEPGFGVKDWASRLLHGCLLSVCACSGESRVDFAPLQAASGGDRGTLPVNSGGATVGGADSAGGVGGATGYAGLASGGAGASGGVAAVAGGATNSGQAGDVFVYVGSGFYSPAQSSLHTFKLSSTTGTLTPLGALDTPAYPSFVVVHPNHRWLYLNIENSPTSAQAYALDPVSGLPSLLNALPSGQNVSAYISTSRAGQYVFQANYASHSVSVLSLLPDGRLGSVLGTYSEGDGAFPHCVVTDPTGQFLFVADRSGERISRYSFNATTGTLTPDLMPAVVTSSGTGPRHIDFHPTGKFAYVINEVSSTLTSYAFDVSQGVLTRINEASTLPDGAARDNSPADMHVHPSGKFAYGVNRGHGSVAVFRVDAATGAVSSVGFQATGGKRPRNFAITPDGRFLVVGVQDSNEVVVFQVDAANGALTRVDAKPVIVPSGIAINQQP